MSFPESRRFLEAFPDTSVAGFRSAAWRTPRAAGDTELAVLSSTMVSALESAAELGDEVGITLLPDRPRSREEHRSYARIHEEVIAVSEELEARGVRPGDRVLIVLPTSFDFIIAFLAIMRLRAIAVPSYPPATLERVEATVDRLAHIADNASAEWCITTGVLVAVLGNLGLRTQTMRTMIAADKLLADAASRKRGSAPIADTRAADASDVAFLQYTSGSTGNPKGVELTQRNVVSNLHAAGIATRIGRNDRVASWLPLYHDMGLIGGLLYPIYWRIPLVLMSPLAFLRRPARWLWMIHSHRSTLAWAPNFAFDLCVRRVTEKDREGLDLSSWRLAYNGAEQVRKATTDAFAEIYGVHGFDRSAMTPVYGLAESTVMVTAPVPGSPTRFDRLDREALANGYVRPAEGARSMEVACVGPALVGHELIIADEHGDALGEREVGHILVRGPSVSGGYYRAPEINAKILRDGWLWTGDLGYLSGGDLYVTGRVKDLIIVRGKNYFAEDIEAIAERIPGVRGGGVVAFASYDETAASDVVIIICETQAIAEERPKLALALREAISQTTGLAIADVMFVERGAIPKTSSGKRQRNLTRERWLKGTLVPRRTRRVDLVRIVAGSALGLGRMLGRRLSRTRAQ